MTTKPLDHRLSPSRKRRRGALDEERSTTTAHSSQPPWKRAKRPFRSEQEANAAYWDSLSELTLTRRALREFDRRNRGAACQARSASDSKPGPSGDCASSSYHSRQIKLFARHGGPDLRDIRGYPEPAATHMTAHSMASSQSTSRDQAMCTNPPETTTLKSSTRKSSAYHRDFEQHLIDHRIYPDDYEFPDDRDPPRPNNENEILHKLRQPRASLSPSRFSDKAFRAFKQADSRALTEAMVMRKIFPILIGDANIPSTGEISFKNLEPLTDGTLVDAKPDFYDGARPAQIDRQIREQLGPQIIPSTQRHAPALPNFFAEAKGPHGSQIVAERQACYNGALGARGIHGLRSFRAQDSETLYDEKAYTITSTYQRGLLKIYSTHLIQSSDHENCLEYHTSQLGAWALIGSRETFQQGAGALRNARDWAKEQRDELIAAANTRVTRNPKTGESSGHSTLSASTNEVAILESETSAEELALDANAVTEPSSKRLKR